MVSLIVNPVEKESMLHLKVQPRVIAATMVGTNLKMQQQRMKPSIVVKPAKLDFMLH